jgi:Symplekin/PTA1 N-terminal
VSIDDVPENHSLLKVKKLEEEGKQAFEMLIAYQASPHISRCPNDFYCIQKTCIC